MVNIEKMIFVTMYQDLKMNIKNKLVGLYMTIMSILMNKIQYICDYFYDKISHYTYYYINKNALQNENILQNNVINMDNLSNEDENLEGLLCAVHSKSDMMRMNGFTWGCASSAYQIEGATKVDNKEDSIWDVYCRASGNISGDHTGEISTDFYHKFEIDIANIKNAGFDAFRFSLSWSRLVHTNTGKPNLEGISYYNKVFDCLEKYKIKSFVTLYHWDLPANLQTDEFMGWADPKIIDEFMNYANICFQYFGPRVDNWITFNEPKVFVGYGYQEAESPPCLKDLGSIATKNVLLSHGCVVKNFRSGNFPLKENAKIGITLNMRMYIPNSSLNNIDGSGINVDEVNKCQELLESFVGIWADPVIFGDYPKILQNSDKIVPFTTVEKQLMMGSVDFIGVNYYSTSAIEIIDGEHKKVNIGKPSGARWLWSYAKGLPLLFDWLNARYVTKNNNLKFYITENGYATKNINNNKEIEINDDSRVEYFKEHTAEVENIVDKGIPLAGYFAWSNTDNFEWKAGYTERFGLIFIDFDSEHKERTPKKSYLWWQQYLQ